MAPSRLLLFDGWSYSHILDTYDVLIFLVLIFTSRRVHQDHLLLVHLHRLLLLGHLHLLLLLLNGHLAGTGPLLMSLLASVIVVYLNGTFIVLKLEQCRNRSLNITPLVLLIILCLITARLMLLLALQLVGQHQSLRFLLV